MAWELKERDRTGERGDSQPPSQSTHTPISLVFPPKPSQLGRALPHHHKHPQSARGKVRPGRGAGRKGSEVWGGTHWDWGTQTQSSRYPMVGAAWSKKIPPGLSLYITPAPAVPAHHAVVEILVQTHTSLGGSRGNTRQESVGISLPRSYGLRWEEDQVPSFLTSARLFPHWQH